MLLLIKGDTVFQDYTSKIETKLINDDIKASDINNIVILLNYSFSKKNNFFVENFNSKSLINVCSTYNKIKTNILSKSENDIFSGITKQSLKTLKFILANYVINFDIILKDNEELCSKVSKQSIKNCLQYISKIL